MPSLGVWLLFYFGVILLWFTELPESVQRCLPSVWEHSLLLSLLTLPHSYFLSSGPQRTSTGHSYCSSVCLCLSPCLFSEFQLDPLHHSLPVPVPCLEWYPDCSILVSASSASHFVFSVPADSLHSFLQIFLSLKDFSLQVPPTPMTPQDVCVCV